MQKLIGIIIEYQNNVVCITAIGNIIQMILKFRTQLMVNSVLNVRRLT